MTIGKTGKVEVNRRLLLNLIRDCQRDELAHLELKMIRIAQTPRFMSLRDSHPEIWEDFNVANTKWHGILKRNRNKRMKVLQKLIED